VHSSTFRLYKGHTNYTALHLDCARATETTQHYIYTVQEPHKLHSTTFILCKSHTNHTALHLDLCKSHTNYTALHLDLCKSHRNYTALHLDCVQEPHKLHSTTFRLQEPQKLHSTTFRLCAITTETIQHYI